MVTELPTRVNDLRLKEEPRAMESKREVLKPNPTAALTLRLDPRFTVSVTDNIDPSLVLWLTDVPLPSRVNDRSETVEPSIR